jgi:uncharacterized protein with HEPN domain
MPKDDMVYVGHMLDTARKALEKVRGKTRRQYDGDEDLRIVLAHLVQTIGEAAARVSAQTRDAYDKIPWKQIVGIRHRIVHDYMDVDYDVLWEVVNRDLPHLVTALEKILPREGK